MHTGKALVPATTTRKTRIKSAYLSAHIMQNMLPPVFRVRYEQLVARGKDGKAEPRGGNDGFKQRRHGGNVGQRCRGSKRQIGPRPLRQTNYSTK